MTCLVYGFDSDLAAWAASRIPHMHGGSFGDCAAIGVMRGDDPNDLSAKIMAVAVFHEYRKPEKTCAVSVAACTPMWARRDIITALLSYPFEQLGVNLIWSAMRHDDERTLRFNEHLGFTREGVLRHRFGLKKHAAISSLTKHEYQRIWKHGQVQSVAPACT